MNKGKDTATTDAFIKHVRFLEKKGCAGNLTAIRSLACMALLVSGWRPVVKTSAPKEK